MSRNLTLERKEQLKNEYTAFSSGIEHIDNMDGFEFAEYMAKLFIRLGYSDVLKLLKGQEIWE